MTTTKVLKIAAYLLFTLVTCSCAEHYDVVGMMFPSSPSSNERFSQSMEYNRTAGFKTIYAGSDSYRFHIISDLHLEKNSDNLDKFIYRHSLEENLAPFTLCLGDLIYGSEGFAFARESLSPIIDAPQDTLFCTAGNHDLYFGLWEKYLSTFHSSSYYFEVVTPSEETDLFICLDSGNGTLGSDQRKWLADILEEKSASSRAVVVFTHTHFLDYGNIPDLVATYTREEMYDLMELFSEYGVDLVLSGHAHKWGELNFKGVRYYTEGPLEIGAHDTGYSCCSIIKSNKSFIIDIKEEAL